MFNSLEKDDGINKKKVYGTIKKFIVGFIICLILRITIFPSFIIPFSALLVGLMLDWMVKYFYKSHAQILYVFILGGCFIFVWIPQVSHIVRGRLPDTIQALYETAQIKDKELGTNAKFYNDLIEAANNDKERYQKRLSELKNLRKQQSLTESEKQEEFSLALQIHEVDENVKRLISLRESGALPTENKKDDPSTEPESTPIRMPAKNNENNIVINQSDATQPTIESTPPPVRPIQLEPSASEMKSVPVVIPTLAKPTLVILLPESVGEFTKVANQNHKKRNIFISSGINLGMDILGRKIPNSIDRRHVLDDVVRNNQSIIRQPTPEQNETTQTNTQPIESSIRIELLTQVVSSGKFKVIETPNGVNRRPAELELHSAFGQKNLKITTSPFNNQEVVNLLSSTLAACPDQDSRGRRTRDILSATAKLACRKGNRLLYVIVNIYLSRGGEIIASTFGIGVTETDSSHKPLTTDQLQGPVLESMRSAIQDALTNLNLSN